MIHYHGTPITPRKILLDEMAGRCFCVRWGAHGDIKVCHEIGQSVMLDNGAFSFWTKGVGVDWTHWLRYYEWIEPWLAFHTTWAVIPDVIDGTEEQNDHLIDLWEFGIRGAPVWHMHESLDRLLRLCDEWPRVCIGSSGVYRQPVHEAWRLRLEEAMTALCGEGPAPVWLHMLRAMKQVAGGPYPISSADSTNVARNHAGSWRAPRKSPRQLADKIDCLQSPSLWQVPVLQV